MEDTALGQAYDHAKNAIVYRDKGSLNAARDSHEQAAGSFANAADGTEDFEAVRLLTLLQEHHKQLAKAISSTKPGKSSSVQASTKPEKDLSKPTEDAPILQETEKTPAHISKTNPALAKLAIRGPRRDLTSSIASNLATARGRPPSQRRSTPLPPDVTAQHAGGKLSSRAERPTGMRRTSSSQSSSSAAGISGSKFSTFYNSIQGWIPMQLAFAGLPLTIEEETEAAQPVQAPKDKAHKRGSSRATAEHDYSALFSSSTIRALREDAGAAFAGHESFYVVPTSGGTRSYAGIVSGREEEMLAEEEGEEFVDARESVGPPSPKTSRGSQHLRRSKVPQAIQQLSTTGKTMEELELENVALRQLLDQQSRRLQMWEASSQSQSMALAQSMRLGRKPGTVEPVHMTSESERVRDLEDDLVAERTQREALEHQGSKKDREIEKLLIVVGKYRAKWDMLKESARQRERNKAARAAEEGA
ncbi:hypothetical protein BT63DRAFT_419657 [Microthyrium microscopicum]|uniref:MIT domain-containing protein n=1 Tax=Microthyrium microscopicum TaxID=703497 RepID=A0A6A6UQ18_9PEZI|nr:hypothetical protein BT63DRAFT_419657 [Microthyrium microscopicum]